MSTLPTPNASVQTPDLSDYLARTQAQQSYDTYSHLVGKIAAFDASTQKASVQIQLKRLIVDRSLNPPAYVQRDYPLLTDCPVFTLYGGPGAILFPVAVGDTCLVLFHDRDLDNWWTSGATVAPNTPRAHSLSDGMVIVGFRPKSNPHANFPTDRAVLRYEDSALELADKVKLYGADASLKSVFDSIITALTALNGKTGPTAAPQILLAQTEINKLTE